MAEKRSRMKRPQPVADMLAAVFAGQPAGKRIGEVRIWQLWEEAVGSQIAVRAVPAAFRDGTLTVRVAGSAWLQQLSLMKQEIMAHLNGALGETMIRDIFFKQGTIPQAEAGSAAPPVSKRILSDEEKTVLRERTAGITSPELREAFIALFASQLADAPRNENL